MNTDQTTHVARSRVYRHTVLDAEGKQKGVREWTLSPIQLSTLTELEDYLRGEPLDVIAPRLIGKAVAIQEIMVAEAMRLGDKRRIGTVEFDVAVRSFSGMSYLLYLSLRTAQPSVRLSDARDILNDAMRSGGEGTNSLTEALFTVAGFDSGNAVAGSETGTTATSLSPSGNTTETSSKRRKGVSRQSN